MTTAAKAIPLARYEHLFIGGAWVAQEDGGFIESIEPSTGRPWAVPAFGGPRDIGRAHRVSSRIKAGMVWVNTYRFIRWSTPYGGFKGSDWGRENGLEALDAYLETRTTVISTTGRFPDAYAN